MKKLSVIMMACLMALGMTQCKKETTPTTQENGVKITLKVGNTSNTRVDVNPNYNDIYAKVNFEVGDIVYVGYNNARVGKLTCRAIGSDPNINVDATFEGTVNIDDYDGTSPLHFYLLGGKGFYPDFEGNIATVDISDQSDKLPVVSYAVSNEPFTGAGSYSTKMMNKCSILKFNVTKPSNANDAICIEGMKNVVTVDFTTPDGEDNGFTYSMEDYGRIKMQGVTSTSDTEAVAMWVIVLPQDELTTTNYAYNVGKTCAGVRPAIPQILSNKYMKEGIDMNLYDLSYTVVFGGGKKVYFAPGNLQYKQTSENTGIWRFAEHQYDYLSTWSFNSFDWVDVFGWATWTGETDVVKVTPSGNIKGPQPLMYWPPADQYNWDTQDFIKEFNNDGIDWVSLTDSELNYLMNQRDASTLNDEVDNARFAKAQVNGVNGVILFPDVYAHPLHEHQIKSSSINKANSNYTANQFSADEWKEMELFGATFLPAAGYRNNQNGTAVKLYANTTGVYWTYSGTDAHNASFSATACTASANNPLQRYLGCAVRLVRVRE